MAEASDSPLTVYFDPFGLFSEVSYATDDTGLYTTIGFNGIGFSFDIDDTTYATARVFSFGVALPIAPNFRLAGYQATMTGVVALEYGTQASVFLAFGGSTSCQDWPLKAEPAIPNFTTTADGGSAPFAPQRDASKRLADLTMADEEFAVSCFSPDFNPRLGADEAHFPTLPPVTVTIGLHARRSNGQRSGVVRIESLALRPLMDPDPVLHDATVHPAGPANR